MTGAITTLLASQAAPSSTPPPIWLMRQAGRYLPEYRALREKAGSFLNLCFNPEWAVEVTLQPLRRFDLSAAIIFSDILVIPLGLGMDLQFTTGEGPRLNPQQLPAILAQGFDAEAKEVFLKKLAPLLSSIAQARQQLSRDKDLIGFVGAPWTLFCYMVEGGSSPHFSQAVEFAKNRPADFEKIMDILTTAVIVFLQAQQAAGADIVKIFDSWAGLIPSNLLTTALYNPHQKIINALAGNIICFPKGIADIPTYQHHTKARVIALDHHQNMAQMQKKLPPHIILQGNLDPHLLRQGGKAMVDATSQLLQDMKNNSYIFNLGHGIDKETPIENVATLVNLVKNFS